MFAEKVLEAFEGEKLIDDNVLPEDFVAPDPRKLQEKIRPFAQELASYVWLKYDTDPEQLLLVLRNVAMANFISFLLRSPFLTIDHVLRILPLFKDTGENAEVRLFAVMHLSKVLPENSIFAINQAMSITLVDGGKIGSVNLSELKTWALKLLSHPRAYEVLSELEELALSTTRDKAKVVLAQLISSCKVFFFTCSDCQLWGFSAIGKIYINLSALQKVLDQFKRYVLDPAYKNFGWSGETDETFAMVTKMAVAMVGLHEFAHLIIRKVVNNANATGTEYASAKYKYFSSTDSGFVAQVRFIDGPVIDWKYVTLNKDLIHKLFQYFSCTDASALKPPKIEISHLKSVVHPIYNGLYKFPAELPFK